MFKKTQGQILAASTLMLRGLAAFPRELKSIELFNTNTTTETVNVYYAPPLYQDIINVSGYIDVFLVSGGNSGNYSANGGAAFTLPITEAALQTNQQAINAGVIVKGSSVGNTAVGKSQTVSGNGAALSVAGVAADFATPETPTTYLGRVNAAIAPRVLSLGTGASIVKSVPGGGTQGGDTPVSSSTAGSTFNAPSGAYKLALTYVVNGVSYVSNSLTFNATGGSNAGTFVSNGVTVPAGTVSNYQWYVSDSAGSNVLRAFPGATNASFNPTGAPANTQPVLLNAGPGTPASANLTFNDAAGAANMPDLAIVGTGYGSTIAPYAPSGSANFKFYYPLASVPAVPAKSGTGAAITRYDTTNPPDYNVGTLAPTNQFKQISVPAKSNVLMQVSASGAPLPIGNGQSVLATTTTDNAVNFTAIYWE